MAPIDKYKFASECNAPWPCDGTNVFDDICSDARRVFSQVHAQTAMTTKLAPLVAVCISINAKCEDCAKVARVSFAPLIA